MTRDSCKGKIIRGSSSKFYIYLLVGGSFLAAYYILGLRYNFFVSTDYAYKLSAYFMKTDVIAMLSKILLIFPATLFLTFYLMQFEFKFNFKFLERMDKRIIIFLMLLAMVFVMLSIHFVFQKTLTTDDERTYEFQAKILKSGRIFAPSPPVKENFKNFILIIEKDRWTGHYPLGHPLILALGMLLYSPYLFPILFSGALVLLAYLICIELYCNKKTAVLSAFLLAISPFFIFTSSTLLTHTSSTFFLGLFMLMFIRSVEQKIGGWKGYLYALLAGIFIGFAFNMRPLTAVGFGLPFAIILFVRLFGKRNNIYGKAILMIAGFSLFLLVTMWYNYLLNGDFFKFPVEYYDAFVNKAHTHSIQNGILNLSLNMIKLNAFLYGFPLSLLWIFLVVFKKKIEKGDKLCGVIILSFAFSYLFWWFTGVSDTGPVYYFDLLIPIVILSSRGIVFLHHKMKQWSPGKENFTPVFLSLSILFSIFTFFPERIVFFKKLTSQINEPYKKIKKMDINNAVVFVKNLPRVGNIGGYSMNSPDLKDNIIYCHLLKGALNARVIRHFPDRAYYILSFNDKKESHVVRVSPRQLCNIE